MNISSSSSSSSTLSCIRRQRVVCGIEPPELLLGHLRMVVPSVSAVTLYYIILVISCINCISYTISFVIG